MSAESLINEHGVDMTVQRSTSYTRTDGGADVPTWGNIETTKIFLQPTGGSESFIYGGDRTLRNYTAFAVVTANIRDGDRLKWNGRTFDIQVHNNPGMFQTGAMAFLELSLTETNGLGDDPTA